MNKPKIRGTAAETAVVKALHNGPDGGWPHAERRALSGALDKGDVSGVPSVCVEVKDCKKLEFGAWLKEAQVETVNANAEVGFVWAKRRGHLDPNDWFVVMDGRTVMKLLKAAGF